MNRDRKRRKHRMDEDPRFKMSTTLSINPRSFFQQPYHEIKRLVQTLRNAHDAITSLQEHNCQMKYDQTVKEDRASSQADYNRERAALQADNNRAATHLQATIRNLRTANSRLEYDLADAINASADSLKTIGTDVSDLKAEVDSLKHARALSITAHDTAITDLQQAASRADTAHTRLLHVRSKKAKNDRTISAAQIEQLQATVKSRDATILKLSKVACALNKLR